MRIQALLLSSFEDEVVREVDIPDEKYEDQESILHRAYEYGQNEVQPRSGHNSVSMGDVFRLNDGTLHVVQRWGFREITQAELDAYKGIPRRDRKFSKIVDPEDGEDLP